jgi:MoaA/NifB/PqqE/SkfB family radical SAM enzyme
LETRTLTAPGLRSLEVGLTSRCNFRCTYCGAYDLREKRVLEPQDIVDAVACVPDVERIKLSGGEVLLEFDRCVELVRLCTERGIETQVNSNGTLLDPDRFAQLEDAGLGVFHFSLNHTDAESHAAFYNVAPRMFDRIVAAIGYSATSTGIDTVAETIIFDETRARLSDINHFVAGLGVRKHELQMEIPSVHQGYLNTMSPGEVMSSIEGLVASHDPRTTMYFSCLSAYFSRQSDEWARLSAHFEHPNLVMSNCVEGKSQLHLHSDGAVMICELGAPEIVGNIFETDLLSIYDGSTALQEFVASKHDEDSFSCFRHCAEPAERTSTPVVLSARRRGPGVVPA